MIKLNSLLASIFLALCLSASAAVKVPGGGGGGGGTVITGSVTVLAPLVLSGAEVQMPQRISQLNTNFAFTNASMIFSNVLTLNPTSTTPVLNGMHLTNQAILARVGDTIDVQPGTYWCPTNEFSMWRNGVNWHLRPGAVLLFGTAGDGASITPPFNDWSGAITSSVTGSGVIIVSNDLANVFYQSNALSKTIIQARTIRSDNEMAAVMQDIQGGEMTVLAPEDGIYSRGYDAYINQCVSGHGSKTFIYAKYIMGDTNAGDSAVEFSFGYRNPGDCYIFSSAARGDVTLADNVVLELGNLNLSTDNVIYSPLGQIGNGVLRNTYVSGTSNRTYSLIHTPNDEGGFATAGTFDNVVFKGGTNRPVALITNDTGRTIFNGGRFEDGFGATNSIRSKNAQAVTLNNVKLDLGLHANVTASGSTNYGSAIRVSKVQNTGSTTNTGEMDQTAIARFWQGIDVVGDVNTDSLTAGTMQTTGQAAISGGLGLYNSITVSRVLMINADGDVTNVVSSSPSTEYVKADGTVGTPTGAQTPWASDINGAGNDLTNVASVQVIGTGASLFSLASYQGDAFALTRATNAPAGTGTTNDIQVAQEATVGQVLGVHANSSGQLVWTNLAAAVVVYRDNALLDWSNTTAETTNLVYTIPAGQLSTNRSLRFTIAGYCTNATVSRTLRLRVYLGSTTLFDQTSAATGTPATNAWRFEGSLTANNSQSVQSLDGFFSLSSATTVNPGFGLINNDEQLSLSPIIGVGAEDTSSAKTLTVTLTYNNTGDAFARRVKSQAVLE